MDLLFEEQEHRPLMFLRAVARWFIVEKEAYAIVETLQRGDYLLHPARGFSLFTDHRNLKFIFNPHSVVAIVPKCTAQKLERWALLLMGYQYVIHDIAWEDNVCADLLSRWGSSLSKICTIKIQSLLVSPLMEKGFEWPTFKCMAQAQQKWLQPTPKGIELVPSDQLVPGWQDGSITSTPPSPRTQHPWLFPNPCIPPHISIRWQQIHPQLWDQ